jgi:hypothetical protein
LCVAPHGVTTGALVGDPSIKTIGVGLLAGLLYEMLKQKRTAGEQAATILLPNCLILDGTGSGGKVPTSEKSLINKGFLGTVRNKNGRVQPNYKTAALPQS